MHPWLYGCCREGFLKHRGVLVENHLIYNLQLIQSVHVTTVTCGGDDRVPHCKIMEAARRELDHGGHSFIVIVV